MTTYGPVNVPAPPPLPPVLGLLSCAITPPSGDGDDGTDYKAMDLSALPTDLKAELDTVRGEPWITGYGYLPRNLSAAINRAIGDVTTVDDPFDPPNETPVIVQPWAVFTKFTLTSLDWEAEDFQQRAEEQLDAALTQAIEQEFWDGTLAQANSWPNNYLSNDAAVTDITPGGGPVSVLAGLGMLQTAMKQGMGAQGMIHVMPEAVPNLLNTRLVGKYLLDMFGNIIVPGVGYSGLGPGGSTPDAGTTWMYATDMVSVRVQKQAHVFPGSFAEALDRSQGGYPNTITFRAFKIVGASFDGYRQFAINVNLPS
jgi:hypothetical protein